MILVINSQIQSRRMNPIAILPVTWLVAVNLVPLAGVFILGWDVAAILFLYWAENLVVGVFNLVKMKTARGSDINSEYSISGRSSGKVSRWGLMLFFLVHYGMFTLGHGVFVLALFGLPAAAPDWLATSLLLLVASHGVSYYQNFLKGGERDRVSYQDLFMQPYARVMVMHITIIFGGFFLQALGSPPAALAVLVMLKIGMDIVSHKKERRKAAERLVGDRA